MRPQINLSQLRSLTRRQPQAYGLELGLRLSGADSREERDESIPWLEAAALRDPYDFRIPETLAYRYHEDGQPALAMTSARLAVDSMYTELDVNEAVSEDLQEREYSLRRTHQFLAQRNRLYVGTTWSRFGVPSAIGAATGDSAFQIASFEHLLGDQPTTAGRQLGIYGRALSSSASHGRYFSDPALGVGLRWKPWGTTNLNTFAEIYSPARGSTDLMLRTSASLLDAGDLRDDWRPLDNRWHWQSLYLDAAYFVRADDYQLYASYIRGYDFRLPDRVPHALAPYVTVYSGHSRSFSDTGAGLGLRYRRWFAEDRYNAWRNRVDLRLELNRSLAGDRRDTNGWRIVMEWQL
jgi:adsorption protein A